MGTLYEDLEKYAGETFSKRDVKAGLKLITELCGVGSIVGFVGVLSGITIPFLGPGPSHFIMRGLGQLLFNKYQSLSAEDRKVLRAVVNRIPMPMSFLSQISDSVDEVSFFADVVDHADNLEGIVEKFTPKEKL